MLWVRIIGFSILGLGALVVWINFYTSVVHYPMHRLRGGTRNDFAGCLGSRWPGRSCSSEHRRSRGWPSALLIDTGGVLGVVLGTFTIVRMILFRRRSS
jgi:hypothetical protein